MISPESGTDEIVPVVLGPTAVGKTELVHSVAREIDGEIISADSRAIYEGMDIGTATPPPAHRKEIPYHLVNFLHPRERYSAADFRRDVEEKIEEIRGRDRRPLIEGGSRLYIIALTRGIFEGPEADEQLREELREVPNDRLHERLSEVDPRTAEKVHPNDTKRLVRALEVYELTGEPISKLKREAEPLPVEFLKVGLDRPRQQLYERANDRVEQMLERGLMDEVKALVEEGFGPDWGAWETIGYKELALHIKGEYEYEEAVEEIKKNTRHLAKYQQNWMKKIEGITRFDLQEDREVKSSLLDLIRGC
ncbi:tRNA (adenosine(37)-N6)-dimethylallyltransferase MiaA [Candidatus Bipolaricaulota bacterium]|nr:tRNA (adenosine(37)-N6)-dimethylallyltransferase MiaA [Candidatus Bipolaricaulota bacterium]